MKDTAREKKKYTKPSKEELKKRLTPLQYKVTQENGTERAYDNEYHNNKREGIYVDIVSVNRSSALSISTIPAPVGEFLQAS